MVDQDIYKIVEQMNKNKESTNSKVDEIFDMLDSIKAEPNNSSVSYNSNYSSAAKRSLSDLKNSIKPVKKPIFPNEINVYENRSDCFINILKEVVYTDDNNVDYVKGHRDALEKYYTVAGNNVKDLSIVEGQVNDELKNRSRANAADMYARGYYDGLEYVSRALVTSKNLVSKKIYQKLLSELG